MKAVLFGFLAVTPFAILLALSFDYKDWQFWAFWGAGYWWSVVAQYLTRDTLIEAVEKLHADALVHRKLCEDKAERGARHLQNTSSFLNGEVLAYTCCLEILKAKQAEGRDD
jgi:hypothetical protein